MQLHLTGKVLTHTKKTHTHTLRVLSNSLQHLLSQSRPVTFCAFFFFFFFTVSTFSFQVSSYNTDSLIYKLFFFSFSVSFCLHIPRLIAAAGNGIQYIYIYILRCFFFFRCSCSFTEYGLVNKKKRGKKRKGSRALPLKMKKKKMEANKGRLVNAAIPGSSAFSPLFFC